MAKSGSTISGVADRYAGSIYELAVEAKQLANVEKDFVAIEKMIAASPEFARLIESPVFSSDEQLRAISAIADKAGIKGLTGNFLRVIAKNRRLFAIPSIIDAFRRKAAEARGEISADVTSAHELTAAQKAELKTALKGVAGKDVAINLTVDPSLLGGLVVQIGSRQIDTSLRTKLNSLKLALKEVG